MPAPPTLNERVRELEQSRQQARRFLVAALRCNSRALDLGGDPADWKRRDAITAALHTFPPEEPDAERP